MRKFSLVAQIHPFNIPMEIEVDENLQGFMLAEYVEDQILLEVSKHLKQYYSVTFVTPGNEE